MLYIVDIRVHAYVVLHVYKVRVLFTMYDIVLCTLYTCTHAHARTHPSCDLVSLHPLTRSTTLGPFLPCRRVAVSPLAPWPFGPDRSPVTFFLLPTSTYVHPTPHTAKCHHHASPLLAPPRPTPPDPSHPRACRRPAPQSCRKEAVLGKLVQLSCRRLKRRPGRRRHLRQSMHVKGLEHKEMVP